MVHEDVHLAVDVEAGSSGNVPGHWVDDGVYECEKMNTKGASARSECRFAEELGSQSRKGLYTSDHADSCSLVHLNATISACGRTRWMQSAYV